MLSRRTFLATALAAGAVPALSDPLGQRPGIQLYTVKDALRADTPGTLKQLAAIGYRTVETFDLGRYSPREFRTLLNANGLGCASCHLNFKDGDNGALFDTAHALGAHYAVSAGLFGAVGADPATADAAAFQAHGNRSPTWWAEWSGSLARTSASQARGSTSLSLQVSISE